MPEENQSRPAGCLFVVLLLVGSLCCAGYIFLARPAIDYYHAVSMQESCDWVGAEAAFSALGSYRDAQARAELCRSQLLPAAEEACTAEVIPELVTEESAAAPVALNPAEQAQARLDIGDYDGARALYSSMGDNEALVNVDYLEACAAMDSGNYPLALTLLQELNHPEAPAAMLRLHQSAPEMFLGDARIGDYITLGAFEQDNTTPEAEAIEWLVLNREGDRLQLISRFCLAAMPYNDPCVTTTWESSTLREWLNNNFYNGSFSEAERRLICATPLRTPGNPIYEVWGGNDTIDHIYLLSIPEAQALFPDATAARAEATPLARAQGAYEENGCTWWWLRSPGSGLTHGTGVSTTGFVNVYNAAPVNAADGAVRPVMYIDIG